MNRQYVGARYVPKLFTNPDGTNNWIAGIPYESLVIVTDLNNSYTSKVAVPPNIGAPHSNPDYWILTGNYNGQVEMYRQEVQGITGRIEPIEESVGVIDGKVTGLGEKVEGLETRVGDVEDELDNISETIEEVLLGDHNLIYFVSAEGKYPTINSAIDEAKLHCSKTNRALIIVKGGIYDESINLNPNPGIDFMGYGAIVRTRVSYPNAPLYISDETTVVGMSFISNGGDAYALHVEVPGDGSIAYNGEMKFINCSFLALGSASGVGVGLSSGQTITFDSCTMTAQNNAGLYLHNRGIAGSVVQRCYLKNNSIRTNSNSMPDALFDDAIVVAGGTGDSHLFITATNNSFANSKVRYRCTSGTVETKIAGSNLHIDRDSCNNNATSLNYYPGTYYQFTGTADSNGDVYVVLPVPKTQIEITRVETNGSTMTHNRAYGENYSYCFTGATPGETLLILAYFEPV